MLITFLKVSIKAKGKQRGKLIFRKRKCVQVPLEERCLVYKFMRRTHRRLFYETNEGRKHKVKNENSNLNCDELSIAHRSAV